MKTSSHPLSMAIRIAVVLVMLACFLGMTTSASAKNKNFFRDLDLAKDELCISDVNQPAKIEKLPKRLTRANLVKRAKSKTVRGHRNVSLVFYEKGQIRSEFTRRILTSEVVVKLAADAEPSAIGELVDAKSIERLPFGKNLYVIRLDHSSDALDAPEQLFNSVQVLSVQPQLARLYSRKAIPNDTHFSDQWHLEAGAGQVDINVTSIWDEYRGAGVNIGIIDDGVQLNHPDLIVNLQPSLHYDFRDGDANPSPDLVTPDIDDGSGSGEDKHGTAVAGLAAARGFNGQGVCGVAPSSGIAGIRLIGGYITDLQIAMAFAHRNDSIHIKNNSWGTKDNGMILSRPDPLALAAMEEGVTTGRSGLGTIYVFAAGNGLEKEDNSNKDDFSGLPYTIAVSAVADDGVQANYSEPGANILICAPAGGNYGERQATTDLIGNDGYNHSSSFGEFTDKMYTNSFAGTSGAAPVVAGVIALMLEAAPTLNWRDVQEILIASAVKNDPTDSDWITNGAGYAFNHKYGAGLIDAESAVNLAKTWTPLAARRSSAMSSDSLPLQIPDNSTEGITETISFPDTDLRVEHVQLTLTCIHPARGELEITLTSPSGTTSRLLEKSSDPNPDILDWTSMSTHFWGESARGDWTIRVRDLVAGNTVTASLTQATITLHGVETAAPSIPVRPTELTATRAVAPGAKLSWIPSTTSVTGYVIERAQGFEQPWQVIQTVGPDITSYFDDDNGNFLPSVWFIYRIKAQNGSSYSDYSPMVDPYLQFTSDTTIYETDFNSEEGFLAAQSIDGQQGWIEHGDFAIIVPDEFTTLGRPGFEQQLKLGGKQGQSIEEFQETDSPIFYTPYTGSEFRFSSLFYIKRGDPSVEESYGFSIWNFSFEQILILEFDCFDGTIYYSDAQGMSIDSGVPFSTNTFYELELIVDFNQNLWHLELNGTRVLSDLTITSTTSDLSAVSVSPFWNLWGDSPGSTANYMLLDDFKVKEVAVAASEAPTWIDVTNIGEGAVVLEWESGINVDTYHMQYKESASATWIEAGTESATEFFPYSIIVDLEPSTSYDFRVRNENAVGFSDYITSTSVTTWSVFEVWLDDYDYDVTLDPLSDQDDDQIELLMEYALGLSPDRSSRAGLPEAKMDLNNQLLKLEYYRARDDMSYIVESSTDLISWTTAGVNQAYETNGRLITASVPMDSGDSNVPIFLRLNVSTQP